MNFAVKLAVAPSTSLSSPMSTSLSSSMATSVQFVISVDFAVNLLQSSSQSEIRRQTAQLHIVSTTTTIVNPLSMVNHLPIPSRYLGRLCVVGRHIAIYSAKFKRMGCRLFRYNRTAKLIVRLTELDGEVDRVR